MDTRLKHLSFRKIVAQLSSGAIKPAAVHRYFIDRATRRSSLNAFIQLGDMDADEALPPLFGAPIAIKDNIDVKGFRTTGGTLALQNLNPRADAPVIAQLRSKGASFLGKTNLHELSFGVTSINKCSGAVRNPHEPTLFAGGSSGGSAAAVAAGLAPIALGTDTGGSCRIPAALCGVFGYRPTIGRYSNKGVLPLSTTRDTIGILSRNVEDIIFLDRLITNGAVDNASSGIITLGIPDDESLEPLDHAVRKAFNSAVETLSQASINIRRISLGEVTTLTRKITRGQIIYEAPRGISSYLANNNSNITVRDVFENASQMMERQFLLEMIGEHALDDASFAKLCSHDLPTLKTAFERLFFDNSIDAIFQPTVPHLARPIADGETMMLHNKKTPVFPAFTRLTDPASCAGLACLSMPLALQGAQIGVELQTPAGSDTTLFAIARCLCNHLKIRTRKAIS